MDNKKREILLIVIGAVVIFGAVLLLVWRGPGSPGGTLSPGGGIPAAGTAPAQNGPVTRGAAPSNVMVPDSASSSVPSNVAKPQLVAPTRPNSDARFRSFSIGVSSSGFVPDTVIVKVGDTVHLVITAVDKDYDFAQPDYGFNVALLKGQAKVVEFQATAEGKFTFYCKSCGGPAKGPVGYIIAAPK